MKRLRIYIALLPVLALSITGVRCTKLDAKVYSQVVNDNFWSTPEEIAAGKSPAYASLESLGANSGIYWEYEISSDEMITPTRGGDWGDGGMWLNAWNHAEKPGGGGLNEGAWSSIFDGVGKCNYIIYTLKNLNPAPATVATDVAEMETVRSYYYYLALDLFGNVPYVTNFKQDPTTVKTIPRAQVYDSVVACLTNALPNLSLAHDVTTYGKVNRYFANAILAKLYLNAEIYTGTPRWAECIAQCNAVGEAGYTLMPNYFDNFKDKTQEASTENIFVVPFQAGIVPSWGGNYINVSSIMANNANFTFSQSGMGNNGMSTTKPFYDFYDTTAVYDTRVVDGNTNVYKTFNDQRTGQFLIGQQYVKGISYPQHQNILYKSSNTDKVGVGPANPGALMIYDDQSGLPLSYFDTMYLSSNPAPYFRLAGLRNIKYWPDAGGNVGDNISNDVPVFRYADILLVKAEAELRSGTDLSDALDNVNMVRARAYSGTAHNWTSGDLTLENLYAERARELAWEMVRRQDMIRFGHFLEARTIPDKAADDADKHTYLLPVPPSVILSNPNIQQNPGY
ncbi:MAG: RagB/SusD family nutrient uptake outer membrane protein [Chitinophagaceae bacterium]